MTLPPGHQEVDEAHVDAHGGDRGQLHGRAVQVDPMKPTLKAPGSKRLNLKQLKLLSCFAFNFNMRRYTVDRYDHSLFVAGNSLVIMVGMCRLTLSKPLLKLPMVSVIWLEPGIS
jgi:hypothetical protein